MKIPILSTLLSSISVFAEEIIIETSEGGLKLSVAQDS